MRFFFIWTLIVFVSYPEFRQVWPWPDFKYGT